MYADFYSDVAARKQLARQAKHKKNGSKSKKCSLPSDHMTNKQWKERCGKVMSYNLSIPMVWADFKKMPSDLRNQYIEDLWNKYSVSAADFARMFGVTAQYVRLFCKEHDVHVDFAPGRRPSKEQKEAWNKFLQRDVVTLDENPVEPVIELIEETADVVEESVDKTAEERVIANELVHEDISEAEVVPAESHISMKLDKFEIELSGIIDIQALMNYLSAMIPTGKKVKLEIECEAMDE